MQPDQQPTPTPPVQPSPTPPPQPQFQAPQPEMNPGQPFTPPPNNSKKKLVIVVIVIVAVLLLAGGAYAFVTSRMSSDSSNSAGSSETGSGNNLELELYKSTNAKMEMKLLKGSETTDTADDPNSSMVYSTGPQSESYDGARTLGRTIVVEYDHTPDASKAVTYEQFLENAKSSLTEETNEAGQPAGTGEETTVSGYKAFKTVAPVTLSSGSSKGTETTYYIYVNGSTIYTVEFTSDEGDTEFHDLISDMIGSFKAL